MAYDISARAFHQVDDDDHQSNDADALSVFHPCVASKKGRPMTTETTTTAPPLFEGDKPRKPNELKHPLRRMADPQSLTASEKAAPPESQL